MVATNDEERIKFTDEFLFASEAVYYSMNILRNHKGVLPCITFGEVALLMNILEWIERSTPVALAVLTTNESSLLVEDAFVSLTETQIFLIVLLVTKALCYLCHRIVCNSKFQCFRRTFCCFFIKSNVSILVHALLTTSLVKSGCDHSVESFFLVRNKTFQYKVCQNRDTCISWHTVCFVTHKVPYRQTSLLLLNVDKSLCKVSLLLWLDESHQRMSCSVGIPKREGSIVGEITIVNLAVCTTILSVNIREY